MSSTVAASNLSSSSLMADADANSALAELEQGLRSSRPGEVCESIVRFPRLLSQFPFPILVNSALLKLADVFRSGDNLAKMCVVRVVTQCSSQLCVSQTLNVAEFTRRVGAVSHANDPVARSLVLRLLSALAEGVCRRKQVLHLVQEALDSTDLVELEAALDAAAAMAELNAAFASAVCVKASQRIERLATPLDVKLRLVEMFRHMHHDSQTAQIARDKCVSMLSTYPSKEFTLALLATLTSLNSKTLVHLASHIELLLGYLKADPRRAIQLAAVKHLHDLASEEYSHLWSKGLVAKLLNIANERDINDFILARITAVVTRLVDTVTDVEILVHEEQLVDLWRRTCASQKLTVAAEGCKLVAEVGARCAKDKIRIEDVDVLEEACLSAEALFLLLRMLQNESKDNCKNDAIRKDCLMTMVRLSKCRPDCMDQLVSVVSSSLEVQPSLTIDFLLALGSQKKGVLKPLLPDLCRLSRTTSLSAQDFTLHVSLATLFCQAFVGKDRWSDSSCLVQFELLGDTVDAWHAFKIARAAMRYGHHKQAQRLLRRVSQGVSSENTLYYTEAMRNVAEGESIFGDKSIDLIQRINEGKSKLIAATTSFAAAVTQSKAMSFQIQFLECRSELLHTFSRLVSACHSLLTSPPPAIAASNRSTADESLHKCGRVILLLRKTCDSFEENADAYAKLGETLFDADYGTIQHVKLMKSMCVKLAKWIRITCGLLSSKETNDNFFKFVTQGRNQDVVCSDGEEESFVASLELQELEELGESVGAKFQKLQKGNEDKSNPTPMSHCHTATLMSVLELLVSSTSFYPRYFFQALQHTTIKLSIAPQPKIGESLSLCISQQLAMRIEGVMVVERKSSKLRRRVKKILLRLHITPSVVKEPSKDNGSTIKDSFEELVEPVDNFFSAQFLLPFAHTGMHQVGVETQLVDEDGGKWECEGARVVISVKVFEDMQARQNNRPANASTSNR